MKYKGPVTEIFVDKLEDMFVDDTSLDVITQGQKTILSWNKLNGIYRNIVIMWKLPEA